MLILRFSTLKNHESVIFKIVVKVLFIFRNACWPLENLSVPLCSVRFDHVLVFLAISRIQIVPIVIIHVILLV